MRVVVLGAGGGVGRQVRNAAVPLGRQVVAAARSTPSVPVEVEAVAVDVWDAAGMTATPVAEADVVLTWTGATAVAVDVVRRRVVWAAPATSPPVLADGQVLLAGPGGFTARPTSTGTPVTEVSAPDVPAGAALSRVGRLVVVSGAGRLAAYG